MDYEIIPTTDIVSTVADGTSGYLGVLGPLITFIAGIVFAVAIVQMLIDLFQDWLREREILKEYTELREEEAEIMGTPFGDWNTEIKNSKNIIARRSINDSVKTQTRRERLEEIDEKMGTLQNTYFDR